MSEQLDHRAAIEWALRIVSESTQVVFPDKQSVNAARHILHSVKAAWPEVTDGIGYDIDHEGIVSLWRQNADGTRNLLVLTPQASADFTADKFERDYPGLKVDEPWLVSVMEA